MLFIAKKYRELSLVLERTKKKEVDGEILLTPSVRADFHDGKFETVDQNIIDHLLAHRLYGVGFFTAEKVADEPNPEGVAEVVAKKELAEAQTLTCPQCGFKAKNKFGLDSHMRSHN